MPLDPSDPFLRDPTVCYPVPVTDIGGTGNPGQGHRLTNLEQTSMTYSDLSGSQQQQQQQQSNKNTRNTPTTMNNNNHQSSENVAPNENGSSDTSSGSKSGDSESYSSNFCRPPSPGSPQESHQKQQHQQNRSFEPINSQQGNYGSYLHGPGQLNSGHSPMPPPPRDQHYHHAYISEHHGGPGRDDSVPRLIYPPPMYNHYDPLGGALPPGLSAVNLSVKIETNGPHHGGILSDQANHHHQQQQQMSGVSLSATSPFQSRNRSQMPSPGQTLDLSVSRLSSSPHYMSPPENNVVGQSPHGKIEGRSPQPEPVDFSGPRPLGFGPVGPYSRESTPESGGSHPMDEYRGQSGYSPHPGYGMIVQSDYPNGYVGYVQAAYPCSTPYGVAVGPHGYPPPVSVGYNPSITPCYSMPPPQQPLHDKLSKDG